MMSMRLTWSRKLCLASIGLGIVGVLGSVGTFAVSFTGRFADVSMNSGSILLTDTTAQPTFLLGPNKSGTDARGTRAECTVPAITPTGGNCTTLLRSVNVAAPGMEPGQYLRGTITISNAGTLPATVAMQVQNVKTNNGNGTAGSAAGVTPCPSDINGVAAPGVSGPQLTTGAQTSTNFNGPVPLTGCLDIGNALRITIQDQGAGSTGPQCLFGNDGGVQAPVSGVLNTGGGVVSAFVASGRSAGSGAGNCDDIGQINMVGTAAQPVLPGANPKDKFGVQGSSTSNTSFAGLSGTGTLVYVPGSGGTLSVLNATNLPQGGDITGVPQWGPGESHSFVVTIALPNTGTTQITDHNHDVYNVGNDNPYQGGAVSFDLYWLAAQ